MEGVANRGTLGILYVLWGVLVVQAWVFVRRRNQLLGRAWALCLSQWKVGQDQLRQE